MQSYTGQIDLNTHKENEATNINQRNTPRNNSNDQNNNNFTGLDSDSFMNALDNFMNQNNY